MHSDYGYLKSRPSDYDNDGPAICVMTQKFFEAMTQDQINAHIIRAKCGELVFVEMEDGVEPIQNIIQKYTN